MHSISNLYLQGVPPGAPCSLSGVMSGNLRTVGMVVEDGPRLSCSRASSTTSTLRPECASMPSVQGPWITHVIAHRGHRRPIQLSGAYEAPAGAMPTTSFTEMPDPGREPPNGALPKAKTPPSDATIV